MKKVICDLCGKEIEDESDYVKMTLVGGIRNVERDFHVSCSVRVKNKIDSFCAAEREKEGGGSTK